MSNYDIEFIRQAEQASYYVNNPKDAQKPQGWHSIKTYENQRTGFKAEAFINEKRQRILVLAGTDSATREDRINDWQLFRKQIPQQANDAYLAYEDFYDRYGEGNVIVIGYSLGGSITQILCNETGAKGVTFAAYGVADIVQPKHTNQIINYGNESDLIYRINYDKHLGERYLIPDNSPNLNRALSLKHHMPQKIGDISKAKKYEDIYEQAKNNSYILNKYLRRNHYGYDDNIFDISNKVFYDNSGIPMKDRNPIEIAEIIKQYYDNGDKLPTKLDLERRVRFGELIYVEDYIRADGTRVTGYYRRYPQTQY